MDQLDVMGSVFDTFLQTSAMCLPIDGLGNLWGPPLSILDILEQRSVCCLKPEGDSELRSDAPVGCNKINTGCIGEESDGPLAALGDLILCCHFVSVNI